MSPPPRTSSGDPLDTRSPGTGFKTARATLGRGATTIGAANTTRIVRTIPERVPTAEDIFGEYHAKRGT